MAEYIDTVLIVIAIILGAPLLGIPFYLSKGWFKWIFHDVLLWHEPDETKPTTFDGCSQHAKCKYCGKDIMQDSQGNWF